MVVWNYYYRSILH